MIKMHTAWIHCGQGLSVWASQSKDKSRLSLKSFETSPGYWQMYCKYIHRVTTIKLYTACVPCGPELVSVLLRECPSQISRHLRQVQIKSRVIWGKFKPQVIQDKFTWSLKSFETSPNQVFDSSQQASSVKSFETKSTFRTFMTSQVIADE